MAILKFILGFIIIVYIVRKVGGFFLQLFFNKQIEKIKQQQQPYQQQNTRPNYREGEINVDYVPNNKQSNTSSSQGEYIDYEEIKD